MKTKLNGPRSGLRKADILQAFSEKQLMWIGAVAMAYNDAEQEVHHAFGESLWFPANPKEISGRINGIDGLCGLIKAAAQSLNLPEDTMKAIDYAVSGEGFTQLKTYRDAVIHAHLFDEGTAVGVAPGGRGKAPNLVLLSEEALKGLYARLVYIACELRGIARAFAAAKEFRFGSQKADELRIKQLEQAIQDATALILRNQNPRRSLLPLPTLPEPTQHHFAVVHKKED
ncbi:MAG: hypothetical protein ACLPPF_20630 [Rhodomicrobium sp.]